MNQAIPISPNLKISDLHISRSAKVAVLKHGFVTVKDLEGQNYLTLKKLAPDDIFLYETIEDFLKIGLLVPPEEEKSIYSIQISTRLRNVLKRNHIHYLSELTKIPIEKILTMRNMGKYTFSELKDVCSNYGIFLQSLIPIKIAFKPYQINGSQYYEIFFKNNILSIEDLKDKTLSDLYDILGYNLTKKLYYCLKKKSVLLKGGSKHFIFEVLTNKQASDLYKYYKIETFEDLSKRNEKDLIAISSLNKKALKKVYYYFK